MNTTTPATALGFLIDPFEKTITALEVTLKDGNVPIRQIYSAIDCDLVDVAHIHSRKSNVPSFDLWVDDEGLYRDEQAFFYVVHEAGAAFGHRMFAGKAMVLGSDQHGNTIGARITLDQLTKQITWAHPAEGKKEAEQLLNSTSVMAFDSAEAMLEYMRRNGAV